MRAPPGATGSKPLSPRARRPLTERFAWKGTFSSGLGAGHKANLRAGMESDRRELYEIAQRKGIEAAVGPQ